MRLSDNHIYIERGVPYIFQTSSDDAESAPLYTNYWIGVKDVLGHVDTIIGLQFEQSDYFKLVPKPVLEQPYQVSMISLYDSEFNEVWSYGADSVESDGQVSDHDKAQTRIDEIWNYQD